MKNKRVLFAVAVSAMMAASGCNSGSSASGVVTYDAAKPAAVMGAMGAAVATTGSKMTTTARAGFIQPFLSSSDCDSHGQPNGIPQNNARYPGALAYCKLTVNDGSPDTVQGGFTLAKSIACALESQNLPFNGTTVTNASIAVTSACFTTEQMTEIGSTITANLTSSSPAAFNTYYQKGVEIALSVPFAMTFKIAASVTATKIEFATFEDQGTNKKGMTAGSLDISTGELRYETRMERLDCAESGSCGWNRHIRMFADLTMEGSSPRNLESVSFAYSNIQKPPGQMGYGGELVTASGTLSSGIKARLWQATDGAAGAPTTESHYQTVGNWTEVANAKCYTSGSEDAGTCTAGLDKFTSNTAFIQSGTFTTSQNFFNTHAGLTFTSVNVNSDVQ